MGLVVLINLCQSGNLVLRKLFCEFSEVPELEHSKNILWNFPRIFWTHRNHSFLRPFKIQKKLNWSGLGKDPDTKQSRPTQRLTNYLKMVAPQRIISAPAPAPARTCDGCDEPLDFEFVGECQNCGTCFGNVCCECEQECEWDNLPIRCDDDARDGVRQICLECNEMVCCNGCGDICHTNDLCAHGIGAGRCHCDLCQQCYDEMEQEERDDEMEREERDDERE